MNRAVIALGSNIKPQENVEKAKKLLAQHFNILNESTFVMTKPLVFTAQDDFLNGSLLVETEQDCTAVRDILKKIEDALGRQRTENKCGPRTIDLDLVVWNDEIRDKDFYQRDFLKKAVLELLPEIKH